MKLVKKATSHKDVKNSFSSVDSYAINMGYHPSKQSGMAFAQELLRSVWRRQLHGNGTCRNAPAVEINAGHLWSTYVNKGAFKCLPRFFLCHNKKSWLIPMFTGQRAIVVLQPLTHWSQLVFYSVAVLCLESTVNASRCRSFFVTHQLAVVWPAFLWAQNKTKFQDASRWFGTKWPPGVCMCPSVLFLQSLFSAWDKYCPNSLLPIPLLWDQDHSPGLVQSTSDFLLHFVKGGKQISFKSTTNHEQARRKTTTSEILMLIWIYVNSFSATHSAKTAEANIWGSYL